MLKTLRSFLVATLLVAATFGATFAQPLNPTLFGQMKARAIGPAVMSGRITALDAVVSNPDIIYAGAASGGVWKSENGGLAWRPIFDEQPNLNIGAIAIQQSNPSVVWVGTGEGNPRNSVNIGNGLYKSIDGGKTWQRAGLENTRNIHRLLIDPTNPNVVYAGVIGYPFGSHPERGVFKTTDGGATWQRVLFTNEQSGVADMIMDPANPQHLLVAMWQHRRTPYDFQSGGPGSGLYATYDGGKTWAKKTDKNGLPAGDFGRLGLAISRSQPGRVYALVEAKKNGLYRSDDGGDTWTKVTEDPAIVTNRPFYFNDIYVDPKNENRVYMIYQPIAVSEDAGKSFRVIADLEKVHADHHALWIHPENPNLIYNGNDGGISISRDRGRTWVFAETIPIGQFYHVNVDNEVPYNVYGGLQDNGSWAGPAYTFDQSGLRNYYWKSVLYGDGFDVAPDLTDSRYGYAMSQGGNLARYDKQTGYTDFVRPIAPVAGQRLRFNWNAALALDPTDKTTIYYGSQYVHKSTDKGRTWTVISPDLTRNDPNQQKQDQSGGLTLDITSAENHNTLLTLAPSALDANVLWAGTDDGNVWITRDMGKAWTNLRDRLPGLPREAWIPQITAGRQRAGEAFVVANNYRNGLDFAPYVYRTTDYGQTWTRLVGSGQVNGYALSFLQDPAEPKLMFCGTEHGLWVSIDEGRTWSQWKSGLPAVSVMDLAMQEREGDLVIGTFGRAIYVLDNIRPLRELARTGGSVLNRPLVVFPPADAYAAQQTTAPGYMNTTDNLYEAPNRPVGATVTYFVRPRATTPQPKPADVVAPAKKPRKTTTQNPESGATLPLATGTPSVKADSAKTAVVKLDTVQVQVYGENGAAPHGRYAGAVPSADRLLRSLRHVPDTALGMQRFTWNLSERGLRPPGSAKPKPGDPEPGGEDVLPGRYKLVFTLGREKDSTYVTVRPDPRVPFDAGAAQARQALSARLAQLTRQLTEATDRLTEANDATELLLNQWKGQTGLDSLRKQTRAMQDSLKKQREFIVGKRLEKQGYGRPYMLTPVSEIQQARGYVGGRQGQPGATEEQLVARAEAATRQALDRLSRFFRERWAQYRQRVAAQPTTLLKEYGEIK